jgi:hypothetical protein
MTEIPPAPAFLDPPGVSLERDVPCRKCGYNLRGLLPEGRCPECGTAVGYSLQGDLLRFMSPDWVGTLRSGARTIILGVAVIILGIVGLLLLTVTRLGFAPLAVLAVGVGVIGQMLMLLGWWWLTQPDPSGLGEDNYGTVRQLIRLTVGLGLAQQALRLVSQAISLPPTAHLLANILLILFNLAAALGLFAQLYYVQKLALRIPDSALSARAAFLLRTFAPGYCLVVLLQMIATLTGTRASALVCFVALLMLAVLILGIVYLRMLEKLSRRLGEQAALARATWAAEAFEPVAP